MQATIPRYRKSEQELPYVVEVDDYSHKCITLGQALALALDQATRRGPNKTVVVLEYGDPIAYAVQDEDGTTTLGQGR